MVSLSNNNNNNVSITTNNQGSMRITSKNTNDVTANMNGNSQRAKSWAVGQGLIDGEDYSAKYYANLSKEIEQGIAAETDEARVWAEGTDEEVEALGGTHSSKGWVDYVLTNPPMASVTQTESGATITVTDVNGTTTANIYNGQDGTDGQDGTAATISVGTVSTGAAGTSASITNSGTSSAAVFNFTIPKGDKGDTGNTGATGNGISSITKTSTSGLVDTYTITYTNTNTDTFTVTNGANGQNGQDGTDGQDGISPTASVTKSGTVATITITDKNGTTTANVYDGSGSITDVKVNNTSVVTSGVANIDLSNYVDLSSAQNITGTKTFVGQKKVGFKQSSSSDKLGFTLYNNSGTEKGYLEFNPSNTIDSVPLMTLGNYASASAGLTHVGFRKYDGSSGGAYNLLTPLVSDAKTPFSLTTTYTNFYLPLGFTDGNTTVKTAKTGMVDLSSILPTVGNGTITINQGGTQKGTFTVNQSGDTTINLDAGGGGGTVDQTYDGTSTNAQSGVAIAGAGFLTSIPSSYLQNTATGTDALTILGTATNKMGATNIGVGSIAGDTYTVTLGYNAQTNSTASGSIVIGASANSSNVNGIAIGNSASVSVSNAIQLGSGTNSTGGLQVYSYQLLDNTTGLIPDARISTNIARTSAIPTVDQTYDSTSANAQSGVAINGAKFLQNTSTQSNSIVVGGTVTDKNQVVCIGNNSSALTYGTAIGREAKTTSNYGTAIGNKTTAGGQEAIAIGYDATTSTQGTIAIGKSAGASSTHNIAIGTIAKATGAKGIAIGYNSQVTVEGGTALGYNAQSKANSAIQLGYGTNSTANTLSIGFYNSSNTHYIWELLDGTTGLIPDARISSNIAMADLSNLSATGKTVIDGQWTDSYLELISSAVTLSSSWTKAYDLSSYLPNDSYKYEVIFAALGNTASTTGSYVDVRVKSDLIGSNQEIFLVRGQTRSSSSMQYAGQIVLPVGTGRTLTLSSTSTGTLSNARLYGYRRIGTNT